MAKQGNTNIIKMIINRYLIDGLSGMALGLFSTLIVGLIMKQIGNLTGIEMISWFGNMASVMTESLINLKQLHWLCFQAQ